MPKIRARYIHAFETFSENLVGYFMNLFLVVALYNWWLGYGIAIQENIVVGLIIFLLSWARKYIWRRSFNLWIKKLYERVE